MVEGRFENVAIVGVGLLGASLGMALKRRGLAARVVGVGRPGSVSIQTALERGAIDEAAADVGSGVKGADLVVLCTPVRTFPAAMQAMAGHLKPGAVVTDVGSVKGVVMDWAAKYLAPGKTAKGVVFVGSHPMAGSEKSGPGAAREDLYEGAVCLMSSKPLLKQKARMRWAPESKAGRLYTATVRLQKMWEAVGMRTNLLDAHEHDAWVATISHLPHAVAGCLVRATAAQPGATFAAAGGFMDSTRIAGGDVEMWTDIFLTNRQALVRAIGEFEGELADLKLAISGRNEAEIRRHLTDAKERRERILEERAAAKAKAGGG